MITECSSPPNGNKYIEWNITFSYIENELWTYTEVEYKCDESHSLLHGEMERLTCGRNGTWGQVAAPKCAPSKAHLLAYFLKIV